MKLTKLFSFLELLEKFRRIERVVYIKGKNEWENDVEHSYQLAMAGWYIIDSNNLDLNKDLVLKYALVHDLVEVYAGDTFFYADKKEREGKKKREEEAVGMLQKNIPEFVDLHTYIEKYEKREDPEAKFVYALDKVLPVINIYFDKGRLWKKYQITYDVFVKMKKDKVAISPEIFPYFEELKNFLKKEEHLFHQTL